MQTPSPLHYPPKSGFSKDKRQFAYTFGVSRAAVQKLFLPQNPPVDASVPGPGAYQEKSFSGKEGERYTMRPRTSIL